MNNTYESNTSSLRTLPSQASGQLRLSIADYDGPMDLLNDLIDRNRFSIYDIPIAEITGQYLSYLQNMDELDMDLASDFLVMAATLVHIKSRMLLPDAKRGGEDEAVDPREELVLQLIEYRRCKLIAAELSERQDRYSFFLMKLPETPRSLGIDLPVQPFPDDFDPEAFRAAGQAVVARNFERYEDLSEKVTHLLRRETVSLPEKIRSIWRTVCKRTKVWFHELFGERTSKAERVTGFLALLELIRMRRVKATQERPFDAICMELDETSDWPDDRSLSTELLDAGSQDYN